MTPRPDQPGAEWLVMCAAAARDRVIAAAELAALHAGYDWNTPAPVAFDPVAARIAAADLRLAKSPLSKWPAELAEAHAGREPADALSTRGRHIVVRRLHADGLTDVEIAERTGLTTYTAARIRGDLGLTARPAAAHDGVISQWRVA